jgi:hypothetical protein
MPRLIDTAPEAPIELGDLVEMLETQAFDPDDEDCFASWGPALARLGENRLFLADILLAELKQRCAEQSLRNQYGPQVIMLHARASKYLIRANIWPGRDDSVVASSGADPFFYGLPHDHNFSFLTVGYLGSGYWSDYYEYDYGEVVGYPGEKVDLRFIERSRLDRGKVMLYRAHRDVHLQLLPDDMSVSLNIMGLSHALQYRDQYRFDLERSEVAGILSQSTLEPLLALSARHGGGNGRDLVESFASRHPSDRIRFAATRALACAATSLDGRIAVFERAAASSNRFVGEMGRFEAERLQKSRSWIEGQSAA